MARNPGIKTLDEQVMENVRRIYRETAEEAVPERFVTLLRQLREQEKKEPGPEADPEGKGGASE